MTKILLTTTLTGDILFLPEHFPISIYEPLYVDFSYFAFISYLCVLCVAVALIVFFSYIVSPFLPDPEKLSSYECGFEPFSDARLGFDVHFYIVGLLYLFFDLEIILFLPWLFSFSSVEYFFFAGFFAMYFLLFLMLLSFFYEWHRAALSWGPRRYRYKV